MTPYVEMLSYDSAGTHAHIYFMLRHIEHVNYKFFRSSLEMCKIRNFQV